MAPKKRSGEGAPQVPQQFSPTPSHPAAGHFSKYGDRIRTIMDIARLVKSGELNVVEFIDDVLAEVASIDKEFLYMNDISIDLARSQAKEIAAQVASKKAKGLLLGVPVSVKDCVCVKGVQSRSGSAILNGYRPLFDATAIARLKAEGAVIIGKTAQDEFGFGSFSTNVGVGFKPPRHPLDPDRATGGSSGGAAGLTCRLSVPHLAVSESTGGSIEAPAALCGVAGIIPTYGLVSRFGLIDYANSFDKIGAMARSMEEAALGLQVMAGFDEMDSTSLRHEMHAPTHPSVKGLKVGILAESFDKGVDPLIQEAVKSVAESLRQKGAIISTVALPKTAKFGVSAYYILAMAEASTNLSKFAGMRYGATTSLDLPYNEYFARTRSANFGQEAKRRVMIGTFARMAGFRDAYYMRAAMVRKSIIDEYKAMFSKVDVLISPVLPITAPKFTDIAKLSPLQQYLMDVFTVGPNLAGVPHGTVMVKSGSSLPVGLMFIADHLHEKDIFLACKEVAVR